jgi:hypothetical protein
MDCRILWILGFLTLASGVHAANLESSLDEVVAKLCVEIQLGFSREEVEKVLDGLPVTQGYRPRSSLNGPERSFQGRALSGMYVITTRAEVLWSTLFTKRQAFFVVMFDEHERVFAVTVDTFGMPAPQCPSPARTSPESNRVSRRTQSPTSDRAWKPA